MRTKWNVSLPKNAVPLLGLQILGSFSIWIRNRSNAPKWSCVLSCSLFLELTVVFRQVWNHNETLLPSLLWHDCQTHLQMQCPVVICGFFFLFFFQWPRSFPWNCCVCHWLHFWQPALNVTSVPLSAAALLLLDYKGSQRDTMILCQHCQHQCHKNTNVFFG